MYSSKLEGSISANIDQGGLDESIVRMQKFDSAFMNKFISEVEESVKQSDEFRLIGNPFKIAASRFAQEAEYKITFHNNE